MFARSASAFSSPLSLIKLFYPIRIHTPFSMDLDPLHWLQWLGKGYASASPLLPPFSFQSKSVANIRSNLAFCSDSDLFSALGSYPVGIILFLNDHSTVLFWTWCPDSYNFARLDMLCSLQIKKRKGDNGWVGGAKNWCANPWITINHQKKAWIWNTDFILLLSL